VTLATDEILLALVPPERIVALTLWADDRVHSNVVVEARSVLPRVRANAEQVVAYQPDLILIAPYTLASVKSLLEASGSPVFTLQSCNSIAEIQHNIISVGRAVGESARARALVNQMERRLAGVYEHVHGLPRPAVLYYIPGGFTAGRGTTMDEIITNAGGTNVAATTGLWRTKKLSKEKLVALNPQFILVGGDPHAPEHESLRPLLLADPALQDIDAVRTGRIYVIPYSAIGTVSHHIIKGVEAIARVLHPQAFQKKNLQRSVQRSSIAKGLAQELAEALGATHMPAEALTADTLVRAVHQALDKNGPYKQ
jgi:iron complex transport system substrate-binding protein